MGPALTTRDQRVCAVIPTYDPDAARLRGVVEAVQGAVNGVVIVDNGSTEIDWLAFTSTYPSLIVRKLARNHGVAKAQNEGIAAVRASGASLVLLLDQDSIPQPGMVQTLQRSLTRLEETGRRVACIGPRQNADLRKRHGRGGPMERQYVISSGSLIPARVLAEVGDMEDDLFIDRVDVEWCMRARARGYQVYEDPDAVLDHKLGDGAVQHLWFGRWRALHRHVPPRYYYMFRNSLILFRRPYVPFAWAALEGMKLFGLFVAFGLLGARNGTLRMMLKGIGHGLRGVTGELAPLERADAVARR